ncbi:biotin--[acetyl-CoA-carboxylase] ligase [Altererythrobacter sp. MF3-039]|uniref:biotin--[acetyl-CoA-carboxylase] ligase n=1 Tax=Altererythrobacter sp. MF3-039 TaxID=3252901 RepID=UPI00390C70C2
MIRYVEETGSTNADLAQRLNDGERVAEGDWLVTDRQTAGRGRQGRNWSDGAGNFMGSTVVRISPADPPTPTLALLTGLALHELVSAIIPRPDALRLKWPNDLLFHGAKLSGILLERVEDVVVIGIGVNLAHSPKLADRPTIALSFDVPTPDRNHFAEQLAAQFALELERWRNFGLGPILRRWTAAATPVGTAMKVHEPDGSLVEGQFTGLGEDGSLSLRLADGSLRAIHAGDVSLV